MSISEKLATISENVDKVFSAGRYVGTDEGVEIGYQNGYSKGREHGILEGRDIGYNEGYANGSYDGYRTGHSVGYDEGEAKGKKECAEKHFEQIVMAEKDDDGNYNLLNIAIPFEPDTITILCLDWFLAYKTAYKMLCCTWDMNSNHDMCGAFMYTVPKGTSSVSQNVNAAGTSGVAGTKYIKNEDGTVTIKNFKAVLSSGSFSLSFDENARYAIQAVKLDWGEKTMKDRITESVRQLPDTNCRAYYQIAKINEIFTDEEWNALMAEKPNCTFNMY